MNDLRIRTTKAIFWNISGTGGKLFLQFFIQIYLARLLDPKDFGLIAMTMVFTSFALVFSEGGFGSALVHRKDATRSDESSVLFCNVGLSLLAYGILYFLSPWIAVFYNNEKIESLLRLIALGIVFSALGMIQGAVLMRMLDFKKISLINMASTATAGVIAIAMAKAGCGVWSLAVHFVTNCMLGTIFLWIFSPWRPVCSFNWTAVRQLGHYGSSLISSQLLTAALSNLNQVLIGRFYTATDLGFYNRAQTLQSIPAGALSQAMGAVIFPAFVHLNDKPEAFKRGFIKAIKCAMAATMPGMILLAVIADPLIRLLLTEKWSPSIPFFKIFCITGIFYPIALMNLNVLLSLGRPGLYLKVELIKKFVIIAAAFIALPYGVLSLAKAGLVTSVLALIINTRYADRLFNLGTIAQLKAVLPTIIAAIAAGGVAMATSFVLPAINLILVMGQSLAFVITYVLVLWMLDKNLILLIWNLTMDSISKKKSKT